jgi:hypothetical protein
MTYVIAAGRSRDRIALVGAETLSRGRYADLRVITHVERLAADASPEAAYEAIVAASDAVKEHNGGEEPKVVVQLDAVGTALWEMFREDYSQRKRDVRPRPVALTSMAGSSGAYVPPNRLIAHLYREWHEDRIRFAAGIAENTRLRMQMIGFRPRESRVGNLGFGDESLDQYDDAVVALALAVWVRGVGPHRFMAPDGSLWSSYAEARSHKGSALEAAYLGRKER